MVGRLYLEHLSDADLALLAGAGEPGRAARPDPERIEALIDSPAVFRALFGTPGRDPLLRGSPFLLFAVLIHRAAGRRAPALPAGAGAGCGGPAARRAARWDLAARAARPACLPDGSAGDRSVDGDGRRTG